MALLSRIFKERASTALIWLGILLFMLIAFARFYPVIAQTGYTFADPHDGRGTLSYTYAVQSSFEQKGLALFGSDLYAWDQIGLPDEKRVISPVSHFWKAMIVGLGQWLKPESTYDAIALISVWVIFLSGFLLCRLMGAGPGLSLAVAFMLANLDNFSMRVGGHLYGLGFYGVPILLVCSAIHYARAPGWGRAMVLGAAGVLSLLVNEYNTYFGFFFVAVLLPSLLFRLHGKARLRGRWAGIASQLSAAGLVTFAAIVFLFPSLIGAKLFPAWFPVSESFSVSRPAFDFGLWSMGNPLGLLQPSRIFPDFLTSSSLFRIKHHEMSFRLGIFLFITLFYCFRYLRKHAPDAHREARSLLRAWLPALVVSVLFAISAKNPVSLIRFTREVAPIFRVGSRSLLYFDIGIMALFAGVVALAFRAMKPGQRSRAILAALCLLTVVDATQGRIFRPDKTFSLPEAGAYAVLAPLPERMLLELPHNSSPVEELRGSYEEYYFFAQYHGKPVLNNRADTSPSLAALGDLNQLDPKKLSALKRLGVGYVSVNLLSRGEKPKSLRSLYDYLDTLPGLRRIAEDGKRRIYEIL